MCLKNGNCAKIPTKYIIRYYINTTHKDTLLTDNTIIFEQNEQKTENVCIE